MSGLDTRMNTDSSARVFIDRLVGSGIENSTANVTPYKVVTQFFVYVNGPLK